MKFDLKSRKFIALCLGLTTLVGCWFATAHWTQLAPNLTVVKDGIEAMVTAYMIGNAAHHFANAYGGTDNTSSPDTDNNNSNITSSTGNIPKQ